MDEKTEVQKDEITFPRVTQLVDADRFSSRGTSPDPISALSARQLCLWQLLLHMDIAGSF